MAERSPDRSMKDHSVDPISPLLESLKSQRASDSVSQKNGRPGERVNDLDQVVCQLVETPARGQWATPKAGESGSQKPNPLGNPRLQARETVPSPPVAVKKDQVHPVVLKPEATP